MKSNGREKTSVAVLIAVSLFALLEARLIQLQVLGGRHYREVSDENRLRVEKVPAPRGIIFDRNGVPLVKNSPYFCVALLPEMLDRADLDSIASFLGMSREEIQRRIKENTIMFDPIKLREGLAFEEVARIEAMLSDYPGLTVVADTTRDYIYGETASHLIGYLGKLSPSQARETEFKDVPRQAFIGQWGMERLHDVTLRGVPGRRVIEVDALGRQLRLLYDEPPVKGEDLYLSIDFRLQMAAEEAFGANTGALVAIKPSTGEVLGLVSRPAFNPNVFAKGINYEDWVGLQTDPEFPMLNRAFQSHYPPGSTFKIITGMAALEEGALNEETSFTCRGGISYGKWNFGCWKKGGHGTLSFHKALVQSCDVYFYNAGKLAGIDAIAKYAKGLGLGGATGVPLVREKTGLIPDTAWKKKNRNDNWYLGETYNASIGQGYVLTTPAQMARMMSAVSNGGRLYPLSLIRLDSEVEAAGNLKLKDETLAAIRSALAGVVAEPGGTGGASRSKFVSIGGKTGTAQVVSLKKGGGGKKFKDHAWFVAYAPAEGPEVALSVFVEHGGHGGAAAAPIAKKAIEAYLGFGEEIPVEKN